MHNFWASLSYYSIAGVLVVLATYVWRARPSSPVNRWFAYFSLAVCAWVSGVGGLQTAAQLEFWGRFTFAAAAVIPATFLGFISWYPSSQHWTGGKFSRALISLGLIISLVAVATSLIVVNVTFTDNTLHRDTGALYRLFVAYFIVTWLVAASIFYQKWRTSRGVERAQLQYLGIGTITSLVGAILANLIVPLATGRSTYSWVGPYFATLLVFVMGHAIIRHRLMDLRPVLFRGLTYLVAIAAVYSALLLALSVAFGNLLAGSVELPASLILAAIIIAFIASPPVKRILTRVIEPYLYRGGRVEYEFALREATDELSHLMDPGALAEKFRGILTTAFVPEFFLMAARSSQDEEFESLASHGEPVPNPGLLGHELARALEHRAPPTLVLLQSPNDSSNYRRLSETGSHIILALGRRDKLSGLIALGPRRSGDPYYARDIGFIESLGRLASVSLENAYLYRRQVELLEYSERLLESLDSAVITSDVAGRLTSFNAAAVRLLGLESISVGARLEALPIEVAWALAVALVDAKPYHQVELGIDHPERGLLPVMLSTAPLHTTGEVTGAFVVITDLSVVKALERNIHRVERLSMMARFYAGLAHEIRTPLTSISTFVSMLHDRFDDPEYRDTAARLLPLEVNRIAKLADRLRFMAPGEGAKMHPIGLRSLLQDIVALQTPRAAEAGISFLFMATDDMPLVNGDASQLTQLFVNLITNAIEAMPHGGIITISIESVKLTVTSLGIRVKIMDEGIGLDSELSAKVFDPFFTTKPSGTGLGLAICKEIADFHSARLTLIPRSDRRRGAVAEVMFIADAHDLMHTDSLHASVVL